VLKCSLLNWIVLSWKYSLLTESSVLEISLTDWLFCTGMPLADWIFWTGSIPHPTEYILYWKYPVLTDWIYFCTGNIPYSTEYFLYWKYPLLDWIFFVLETSLTQLNIFCTGNIPYSTDYILYWNLPTLLLRDPGRVFLALPLRAVPRFEFDE
jgi:hypothetical protein